MGACEKYFLSLGEVAVKELLNIVYFNIPGWQNGDVDAKAADDVVSALVDSIQQQAVKSTDSTGSASRPADDVRLDSIQQHQENLRALFVHWFAIVD